MVTPIPQIILAIEGKWDCVIQTTPEFAEAGANKGKGPAAGKPPKARDSAPTEEERATVAQQLKAILGGGKGNRKR